jgi:hypothetical protein
MNSRLTVLALVAVLLAAFAVPALAAPSEATPDVQGISTRALAKARLALLTARSAKSQSRTAARTANSAVNTANEAKSVATTTQATLDSTKVKSALAAGAVSTEAENYVQLPGGPSLPVTVSSSGLIEVWAQVTFLGEGAVALFEDGQRMPGQSEECAPSFASSALIAAGAFSPLPHTLGTPSSVTPLGGGEFFCGVEGPPAGVLFQTTPGSHTYELRYQFSGCGCEPEVTFSNRLLRVAPRL